MEVLILQVFVSLVLVVGSLILFINSIRERSYEHSDRLALLAIEPDDASSNPVTESDSTTKRNHVR